MIQIRPKNDFILGFYLIYNKIYSLDVGASRSIDADGWTESLGLSLTMASVTEQAE